MATRSFRYQVPIAQFPPKQQETQNRDFPFKPPLISLRSNYRLRSQINKPIERYQRRHFDIFINIIYETIKKIAFFFYK